MTPLHFETLYQPEWAELEAQLRVILAGRALKDDAGAIDGERVASLYRRACEHLALARARAYPRYLLDRLEKLTADAHQVIYQHREYGFARIRRAALYDFPRAVRAHASYVWVSTALSVIPMLLVGWVVYQNPDLILSVVDFETAADFEEMYSDGNDSTRIRDADSDWMAFGFYIQNNISVAFRFFAGGLLFGVGSIFFILFNGVYAGAIAGYLTERGLSSSFYSFVVTHAAFELTAFFLAGGAGLRLGHALIAPGRNTRRQSLVLAARESMVIIYGVVVMLIIAAAIEAFWSSARWLPLPLKYSVAGVCWLSVIAYFTLQGRRAD
ncbi:MAG: stage II sporulation protein M [Steroidobacteraceae bacterium]|nr:stage II sporulation protein M [Steroidobacteraceae bacterium]